MHSLEWQSAFYITGQQSEFKFDTREKVNRPWPSDNLRSQQRPPRSNDKRHVSPLTYNDPA